MEQKYLTIEKADKLEDAIGFLSNYTLPIDEEHVIKNSAGLIDEDFTKMLEELGKINERRKEIIKMFNDYI